MSSFMNDIGSIMGQNPAITDKSPVGSKKPPVKQTEDGFGLNMQDFLTLMVTELQSQGMDSTADTSEMLNQMVMMQMVSALTNMTDASVMGYAASLVGKTVTVGRPDSDGQLQEIVGQVTGTGMLNGKQVIFVNDEHYYLSEIMAVGTLPAKPGKPADPEKPADPQTPPVPENPEKPVEPQESTEPTEPQNP